MRQLQNHRTAEPQNHSYFSAREPSTELWNHRTTELEIEKSATTEQHATQMQKNTMIRMRQLQNHRTAEPQNHSYFSAREPSTELWDRRTTELKIEKSATTEQHATQMQKNTMIRMRQLQNHRNAEPQNHSYFSTREPSTELWNHRTTELENYRQDKHWNTVTEHMDELTKMRPMNHRSEQLQSRKN